MLSLLDEQEKRDLLFDNFDREFDYCFSGYKPPEEEMEVEKRGDVTVYLPKADNYRFAVKKRKAASDGTSKKEPKPKKQRVFVKQAGQDYNKIIQLLKDKARRQFVNIMPLSAREIKVAIDNLDGSQCPFFYFPIITFLPHSKSCAEDKDGHNTCTEFPTQDNSHGAFATREHLMTFLLRSLGLAADHWLVQWNAYYWNIPKIETKTPTNEQMIEIVSNSKLFGGESPAFGIMPSWTTEGSMKAAKYACKIEGAYAIGIDHLQQCISQKAAARKKFQEVEEDRLAHPEKYENEPKKKGGRVKRQLTSEQSNSSVSNGATDSDVVLATGTTHKRSGSDTAKLGSAAAKEVLESNELYSSEDEDTRTDEVSSSGEEEEETQPLIKPSPKRSQTQKQIEIPINKRSSTGSRTKVTAKQPTPTRKDDYRPRAHTIRYQ